MKKSRVMIVEDQVLVCDALASLLALSEGITIVATANDAEEALQLLAQHEIDLLLSDIEMPGQSGIALVAQARAQYPDLACMIMTTFNRAGYIRRALEAGATGFVLKDRNSDYLVAAINDVLAGKTVIEPELALMALNDTDPLTEKERQALKLAGDGLSSTQIAEKMCLARGTVRNYLSEAISKLNAANRIDAARIAKRKGWL